MKPFNKSLCWFLAWLMLITPTAVLRAQETIEDNTLLADPAIVPVPDVIDTPLDVTYLLPQSCLVVSVRPQAILNAPIMKMMPIEVLQAGIIQQHGIDVLLMDRVLLSVEPPAAGPPNFAVMASFTAPVADKVLPALLQGLERNAESKRPHYRSKPSDVAAFTPSLYFPSDSTALVTFESTLQRFLLGGTKPTDSSLHDRLMAAKNDDLYAAVDFVPLRPLLNAVMMQNPIPPQFHYFYTAPDLIKAIELRVNISHAGVTEFVVEANNADDAEKLEQIIIQTVDMFKSEIAKEAEQLLKDPDPVQQALGRYQQRLMNEITKTYMPTREGSKLFVFHLESDGGPQNVAAVTAVSGILVALLLPAVQAAREAARRNTSMNNLKQIMLAMHNYYDSRKSFPAHAGYSADGKPLLSWRVHILPYLEQQALYEQFHLDEPWDSAHNSKLIQRMPDVFLDPSSKMATIDGRTHYLGVKGADKVFNGTKDGITFGKITDGTSNTVAVLQVNDESAVPWTKPADWELNEKSPMIGLANSMHPGTFAAGYCDGSVRMIAEAIDPTMFKALLTIAGGETIPR
jgi:type II secretory pathway pseudopilin PulG